MAQIWHPIFLSFTRAIRDTIFFRFLKGEFFRSALLHFGISCRNDFPQGMYNARAFQTRRKARGILMGNGSENIIETDEDLCPVSGKFHSRTRARYLVRAVCERITDNKSL